MADQVEDQKGTPLKKTDAIWALVLVALLLGAGIGFWRFRSSPVSKKPEALNPVTPSPVASVGVEYTLKLHFQNNRLDPDMKDCRKTFEALRKTTEPPSLQMALAALLAGPNGFERQKGFDSVVPSDAVVKSAQVKGTTAYVDFSRLESGGSCQVAAIRAQIENTVRANTGVSEVVLSLNGDKEELLQP